MWLFHFLYVLLRGLRGHPPTQEKSLFEKKVDFSEGWPIFFSTIQFGIFSHTCHHRIIVKASTQGSQHTQMCNNVTISFYFFTTKLPPVHPLFHFCARPPKKGQFIEKFEKKLSPKSLKICVPRFFGVLITNIAIKTCFPVDLHRFDIYCNFPKSNIFSR